jgi:hypothetical protein
VKSPKKSIRDFRPVSAIRAKNPKRFFLAAYLLFLTYIAGNASYRSIKKQLAFISVMDSCAEIRKQAARQQVKTDSEGRCLLTGFFVD